MPNAQTHLAAAHDLLADPGIIAACPALASDASRAAFLMGAISPDARALSGQPRETTHFFTIPPDADRLASEVMLADWPAISAAGQLSSGGAAFVAGYMTHLIMDQVWVEMIVMPRLFLAGKQWGLLHPSWRLYCILMTYMEYRAAARLPVGIPEIMRRAHPDGWLPFLADKYLSEWRDRVTRMIEKGGARQVSKALAQTCLLSSDAMEAIVLSESRMAQEAYPVVSREELMTFESETMRRCRHQIMGYLGQP